MATVTAGTAGAAAGEKRFGSIEAGTLATGTPIEVPVCVVNGGAGDGPRLYVQALCHGSEINGLEALRRVLVALDPAQMRGILVAVPVANTVAFMHKERRTSFDNEDMNRVWPGKPDGALSARMAHAIWNGAILGADYLVDLHTGSSTMLTHSVFGEGDDASEQLARVFGTEYLLMEEHDEEWRQARFAGKLRNVAVEAGIPSITPELGGNAKFEEARIREGEAGVRNVMIHLGMIDGEITRPARQVIVRNHLTRVTVSHGGIFLRAVQPGDEVSVGTPLGTIISARDFSELETVRSPLDGIVLSHVENPILNTGDSCAMLGKRGEQIA